jgi:hypothetical protein
MNGSRFSADREGVSETLGEILLVITSVVMLSALALQLLSLPPPVGTIEADTVASFDGMNVTIENVGGADLVDGQITIDIAKEYNVPTVFSISSGHPGGVLRVGESWTRDVSAVVAPTDRVHVVIVDSKNSRVLSDQMIVKGQDYSLLPDVGLTKDDVTFWRAGAPVDDDLNAALEGDIITVNITVHNYGQVPVENVTVASSVSMYVSTALPKQVIPFLNSVGNSDDQYTVTVLWIVTDWGPHTVYVRVIPLRNESIFTNNYVNKNIQIGPGIVTPDAPDLNVTAISFSNNHPIHGDTVKIFVRIANQGGLAATASLTYWDNMVALYTDNNLSVSSGQLLEVYTVWIPMVGGVHSIFANVSVTSGPPPDANPGNNNRTVLVEVLPTIMLVDDDKAADGSLKDVTSPMRAALSACAAKYTLYQVSGGDGPKYDSGPSKKRLMDYDLVIWLCGYTSSATLSANDVSNLTLYLNNGGKLWIIGQDVVSDLQSTSPAWLSGYLHVSGQVLDAGLYNPLQGVPQNDVTRNMTVPINSYPWAGGLTDLADKVVNDSKSVAAFWNSSTTSKYGLMFNASTNGSGPTYTMALFSYEFSQVRSANDRANITYQMLKWFGCTVKFGRDLALSDVVLSKTNPDFMDEVNITVWVRNNGQSNEPVGTSRVLVLFLMDNAPIAPYEVYINGTKVNLSSTKNPVTVPFVRGDGGITQVTLKWLANKVGAHTIWVEVDPFNLIPEIDEENNVVWGSSMSKLSVRYSVLVVDDDDSPNNRAMATNYNSTFALKSALDRLGYAATAYVVPDGNANGPTLAFLRRYNTVIWMTGQCAPGAPNPLTALDQANLQGFLSAGDDRGLWLIGQDMFPSGLYGAGTFIHDYLHITSITQGMGVRSPLYGVKGDAVGHGINYTVTRTFNPVTGGSIAAPDVDAQGVTYANISNSSYNSVRYFSSSMAYKTIYCGWDLSFIDAKAGTPALEYQAEFAYMALHWLGMPEPRIELRVTDVDLYYGNLTPIQYINPSIGNSYVIKAIVSNLGGTRGDCSVRFLDGTTVIGTAFVSVAPGGRTVAEIVWTPLFAGARQLSVQLDPDSVVPQIIRFNDRAVVPVWTYFFYDDMENGTRNWVHQATVLRINGESALEYMDTGNVTSGVGSAWQALVGFGQTASAYHSMNSSFYMQEPASPLDLVMVFDNSNSTTVGVLADEKAAAISLMNNLTGDSRVAVFMMNATFAQRKVLDFTLLDTAGRASVTAKINALTQYNSSNIWMVMGDAINYADSFHAADKVPAVLAMCDGQDYLGSDAGIGSPPVAADYTPLEKGSHSVPYGYCPWWDWSTTTVTASHTGKYFGKSSAQGYWFTQTLSVVEGTRKGLLNAPVPVFTVGINIEHDSNLPSFNSTSTPADVTNYTRNGYNVFTGAGSQESGTPEYNLWRVSSTSPKGQYIYVGASPNLTAAFANVSKVLSSLKLGRTGRDAGDGGGGSGEPGAGTDGSAPGREPLAQSPEGAAGARSPNIPGANDLYALTQTVNLQGVSTATLSFWQKYSITMGYSGTVLLVGTSADNITFTYKYITPSQSYKGNIRNGISRFDDLGNEIRWCWNGVSGNGAFDWEYAQANLNQFCGQQYVRIMFAYLRAGGGGGLGWWLDDIEVKVSRSDSVAVANDSADQWELVQKGAVLGGGGDTADAYSGQYAWLCHNPDAATDYLKGGLDDYLATVPIDLTKALDVKLIAKFKFNINYTDGRPPDGFRVEVSSDTGISWRPIQFGARAAWKVSGTEAAGADGKSFTGVDIGGNWVYSTSLTRLNCDLSGWAGSVIQIRFRVITRNDAVNHFFTATGWGGFYVDDVTVFGNTTANGRSVADQPGSGASATAATAHAGQSPGAIGCAAAVGTSPSGEGVDISTAGGGPVSNGLLDFMISTDDRTATISRGGERR